METFKNDQKEYDVMKSAFGISRAIKRRPFKAEHILPPGMERTLMTIAKNDGASSGELCEILDVRPSSLSEIADKMAQRGLVEKKDAAEDRRVTRICLTELGKATADQIEKSRNDAISALTACFTEDEAKQFCILADKLAAHLRSLGEGDEEGPCGPGPFGGPAPFGGPGHCGHGPGGSQGPGKHCHARHFMPMPCGPWHHRHKFR